jgi:hypothetical protein
MPKSNMSTLFGLFESFISKESDTDTAPVDEELDLEEQQQQTMFDISELNQAVKVASEGALTSKTVATYRRHFTLSSNY